MTWRGAGRVCGAALTVATLTTLAHPAAAQNYERMLAGIRLNSTAGSVLAKYGNPNEIIIGEVGVRANGPQTASAGATGGGFGGYGGGGASLGGAAGSPFGGGGGAQFGGGGLPGIGGGAGFGGRGGGKGGEGGPGGGFGAGSPFGGGPPSGAPGGFAGGPSFGGGGAQFGGGGPSFGGGGGGGYGGGGGGRGGGGGFGGGQFGQTISPLATQQEVTWIYNRKVNNNLVSYEFLIGPDGHVVQIRVSGYSGGDARTGRRIALNSTYKDVVRSYGYPEEHYQVGRVLVASYRKAAHVQFQFLNDRGVVNPMAGGNKVIAITIATVE